MSSIFVGRHAAHTDESFVVFLVGMSINQPLAIHRWMPIAASMPAMVAELRRHPEKGLLDSRTFLSWPLIMVVQYWKSFEALEKFARSTDDLHLPTWKRFNQQVGKSGVVGIFHETYMVSAGQVEAIYVNTPKIGLAKSFGHQPATGSRSTARRRIGGYNEPAVELVEAE